MTIYSPDDVPEWTQGRLRGHEEAWLEHRRSEADREDDRPPRSLSGRMQRAVDRWSQEAGWVALGLSAATALIPPPSRGAGERRGTAVSDPTGAVLYATLDTMSRTAAAWAHLADRCPWDGVPMRDGAPDPDGMVHECPKKNAAALFDYMGVPLDTAGAVDGLLGTAPSSTVAFGKAVDVASTWHSVTAATAVGAWRDLHRLGAETSVLETVVTETEDLAARMASLAGTLAAWSGREERRCKAGCGGAKPDDRATCDRCRQRSSRANRTAQEAS